ncbi:hypothetical protein [Aurantimonas sp. VKM B-3413]|uniref:hypothetical protein n=1 Tax=Aurantimonas sp. VKM B-3413 TaxID=2779401 RepID=UPI001E28E537|nr:hypothetical protein [Aurantimonas sp. VKM B-3413]MCB8839040.1 hypothetical protein [Aurantimonas sp. VKM B-3413]
MQSSASADPIARAELLRLLTDFGERITAEQRRHVLGFLHLAQDRPLAVHLDVQRDGKVSLFLTTDDMAHRFRADQ